MSAKEKLSNSGFLSGMYEKRWSPMGRWVSIGLVILGLILFIVSTIIIGASDADGIGSILFIAAFVAIGLPTVGDLLFELAGFNANCGGAAPAAKMEVPAETSATL